MASPYTLTTPFHLAIPVHNLELAKEFYGNVLECTEGRSSTKWQDYNFYGHQLVVHWVGETYRGADYFNPVDGDEVPVAHFGVCLTSEQFDELAARMEKYFEQFGGSESEGTESKGDVDLTKKFIIKPHQRFTGQKGEQKTMFFKDPSGNNLEFKAMTNPSYLFEKAGNY